MSDSPIAPFIVPKYDGTTSIRDWHIEFATQNVEAFMRLRKMRPRNIVLVTIDPADPKPKVSFRTEHNMMAMLPPEEAEAVSPEKIVVMTQDPKEGLVVTRFRIGVDDAEGPRNREIPGE